MAQPDPIERPDSDEPIGAPGGTRHRAPLQFPRQGSREGVNVWRITLYFVVVVIALALITYFIVHPR